MPTEFYFGGRRSGKSLAMALDYLMTLHPVERERELAKHVRTSQHNMIGPVFGAIERWAEDFIARQHGPAFERLSMTPAKIDLEVMGASLPLGIFCDQAPGPAKADPPPPAKESSWRDRPPLL